MNAAIAAGGQAPSGAAAPAWVAVRRVAVTDNTVESGLDGHAVLAANQLTPRQVIGVANTGDAASMVRNGDADAALVYRSDVQGNAAYAVLITLTAAPMMTSFAGAVSAKAVSPKAQQFLDFMRGGVASARLQAGGLSVPA